MVQAFQFVVLPGAPRLGNGLPPLHLLHEELRGHGGIALGLDVVPSQMQQVLGALQGLLQGLVGLVGPRRPLHGEAPLRIASVSETIRMHLPLYRTIAQVQVGHVDPEEPGELEQREKIGGEIHQKPQNVIGIPGRPDYEHLKAKAGQ